MLPLPGAPSASWARYRQGFARKFEDADLRACTAFWLIGLINNVLYVIILSAALDLVGPSVPKAAVLLCDVLPGFLAKLTLPYIIQPVPYAARVVCFVVLSTLGMCLIALTPAQANIATKMAGVVLASLSSGAGELSFLGLTYFYGPFSLAAWGSGTGAAGLIGAGMYTLFTTSWGLSSQTTLSTATFLPLVMFISYFMILPKGPLASRQNWRDDIPQQVVILRQEDSVAEERVPFRSEQDGLNDSNAEDGPSAARPELVSRVSSSDEHRQSFSSFKVSSFSQLVRQNLSRSRQLLVPYMIPLFLVYLAEYLVNQSVAPVLLFPLSSPVPSIVTSLRDFYPLYNAIYQLGVFISRSSTPFMRIRRLYPPALLQWINLIILILFAIYFVPDPTTPDQRPLLARALFSSVYPVFLVIFWEGLLGGAVYVNTFAAIGEPGNELVRPEEKEFALGAVTVSDSAGIMVAGLAGMGLEVGLCGWQVRAGRRWCRDGQ